MFDAISDALSGTIDKLTGSNQLNKSNIQEGLREVKKALLEADVNFKVVGEFVDRVEEKLIGISKTPGLQPSHQVVGVVHEELVNLMGPIDTRIKKNAGGPTVIMMVGLQGAGKTTTCAKFAKYLVETHKMQPLLVAADLQRPGAIEQLKINGEKVGVPVYSEQPQESGLLGFGAVTPPKVCANALKHARKSHKDVVILDTAGRLQIDESLMTELQQIKKKVSPQNIFFVCDAMSGQDAVNSAKGFNDRLEVSGVIMTKLDGDARGGAALSIKSVTGKTIKFVGEGERMEDFREFRPEGMADRILNMGDIVEIAHVAKKHMSEEAARSSAERMMRGEWNFEDFQKQLEMITNMGPLKKLMSLIPGMGQALKGVDISHDDLKPIRAIIASMTRQERRQPGLLNGSRRRRVALGSGTAVSEVNAVIKQFKAMKKMIANMSEVGGLGSLMSGDGINRLMSQMPGGAGLGGLGGVGRLGGVGGISGGASRPARRSKAAREERKRLKKQKRKNRKKKR